MSQSADVNRAGRARSTDVEPATGDAPVRDPDYRGTGIYLSVVAGLLIGAILILFIAQNTEAVSLEWAVWDARVSLAVIVIGSFLLGVAAAVIGGAVWRHRRRTHLRDKAELERLRAHERSASPPA